MLHIRKEISKLKYEGTDLSTLPPILENRWSCVLPTWCAEGRISTANVGGLIKASNCWICS
jgi:hypothetical protein